MSAARLTAETVIDGLEDSEDYRGFEGGQYDDLGIPWAMLTWAARHAQLHWPGTGSTRQQSGWAAFT